MRVSVSSLKYFQTQDDNDDNQKIHAQSKNCHLKFGGVREEMKF
jgi:hypothetical protein